MNVPANIVVYTVDKPFDVARRQLLRAFELEGLRVPHELDTSARVKSELGVGLRKSVVLYVDDPILQLEATEMTAAGGLFIPEPVSLSEKDRGCRVSVRSIQPFYGSGLPASLRTAGTDLHERILAAIQRVGQKETAATVPAPSAVAV